MTFEQTSHGNRLQSLQQKEVKELRRSSSNKRLSELAKESGSTQIPLMCDAIKSHIQLLDNMISSQKELSSVIKQSQEES